MLIELEVSLLPTAYRLRLRTLQFFVGRTADFLVCATPLEVTV